MVNIFFVILRSIALPLVVFLILRNTVVGEQGAFLAVTIAATVINLIAIILNLIRILPSALLLRANKVMIAILSIIIQLGSIIGFWIYYFTKFN